MCAMSRIRLLACLNLPQEDVKLLNFITLFNPSPRQEGENTFPQLLQSVEVNLSDAPTAAQPLHGEKLVWAGKTCLGG